MWEWCYGENLCPGFKVPRERGKASTLRASEQRKGRRVVILQKKGVTNRRKYSNYMARKSICSDVAIIAVGKIHGGEDE